MKNLNFGFTVLFLVFSFAKINATNPISVQAHYTNSSVAQTVDERGVLKKMKTWVQKKLIPDFEIDGARTFGIIALVLGILSILGWFFVPLSGGWVLILMAAFAIAGDIFAGITLWNTRENKAENKLTRRMAWWGLILSLLTGLAPLALFIIVLATL